jgi:hypothetical protein
MIPALQSKMIAFHWPMIRIGWDDETGRFLGLYLFNFSPEMGCRDRNNQDRILNVMNSDKVTPMKVVSYCTELLSITLCQFSFCYLVIDAKKSCLISPVFISHIIQYWFFLVFLNFINKTKTGIAKGRRLLIATNLDQSNNLSNQQRKC